MALVPRALGLRSTSRQLKPSDQSARYRGGTEPAWQVDKCCSVRGEVDIAIRERPTSRMQSKIPKSFWQVHRLFRNASNHVKPSPKSLGRSAPFNAASKSVSIALHSVKMNALIGAQPAAPGKFQMTQADWHLAFVDAF
jgi:hypothetical protein